jgi:hypothetical protein
MSERPTDKAKLLESLPEGDMVDVRVLLDLMSKKRHQASMSKKRHQASMSKKCHQASRDTSEEPVIIVGLTAIHVTAWDWNAAKIKNFGRDQAPFVQAIILERKIAGKYRSQILSDPVIASFRKTLETTLIESASKIQTIGDDDTLVTLQKWTWWDELVLPGNTMDAHAMKNSMQGTDLKVEQWRVQQLLVLEEQDRSAINKMVTYVTSMPCAKASAAKTSSLSQDVLEGLITLLKVSLHYKECYDTLSSYVLQALELNSSRLRMRAVDGNSTSIFHQSQIKNLGIMLPNGLEDKHSSASSRYTIDQPGKTC